MTLSPAPPHTQAEEAVHSPDEPYPLLLAEQVSVLPPQPPALPPLLSLQQVSVADTAIVDARQKPSFPPSSAAAAHQGGHPPPLAPAPGLLFPSLQRHNKVVIHLPLQLHQDFIPSSSLQLLIKVDILIPLLLTLKLWR